MPSTPSRLLQSLPFALAAMAAPLLPSTLPAQAPTAARPNVIVILLDDAGYADFGFMGSKDIATPAIDRIAREGVVLDDFHVTSTVCAPSRAGLLTGQYQHRFGFEANIPPPGHGIDPSARTLARALRDEGYRSTLVGKWHLGVEAPFHPLNHGFDHFYGFLEGSRTYFPAPAKADAPRSPHGILRDRTQVSFEGYLTDVLTDEAIRAVRDAKDQPFFLFLSYNAPHTPMEAKPEILARYQGHPRAVLAAMMESVDEGIGRLHATLEELGIKDNTLIFFFSDNGGAENNDSDNRPLKGWKGNEFEGGHRVPAIVSWPARIPGGRRHAGLASALDVFPTALAAARGGPVDRPELDGIDLVPQLLDPAAAPANRQLFWRKGDMAAMRSGPLKLIRLEGYGYRLYDTDGDLGESVDLQETRKDDFREAIAAFGRWEESLPLPRWYERGDWPAVTWEIHHALMNNREPRFRTPEQMRRANAQP